MLGEVNMLTKVNKKCQHTKASIMVWGYCGLMAMPSAFSF